MADGKVQDSYIGIEGYVGATHWSKPYYSNHYHENPPSNSGMLGHVNCSYLSTPGRPPTLEALKQHAQSLTYLISTLAPSTIGAEADNENLPAQDEQGQPIPRDTFPRHQAYDWLNNLQVPYDNIDKAHRMPLNSLVNLVKENSDKAGVIFHCPLTELTPDLIENDYYQLVRPFQTHMTLLMHANECLERLDHEYSAMGGILGIIPTDAEEVVEHPELNNVKSTLIGQWLLHTQHLVSRMHELEISYANALDLLASEAIVPAQQLSVQGPDGRSGREVVFPQDRWILSNSGEDVFNFIHQMLDKSEAKGVSRDRQWFQKNVVGETLRDADEEQDRLRGIAHVDLQTRFYRLRGSGHGPIFVLPAFSDRPNTSYTKEIESRPTVVTIPAPSNPDRTSAWDRRHKDMDHKNKKLEIEISRLRLDKSDLETASKRQEDELERLQHLNRIYEEGQGEDSAKTVARILAIETERDGLRAKFEEGAAERNQLKAELAAYKRARQPIQVKAPAGVTLTDDGYLVPETLLGQYEERTSVMASAKQGVQRVRNVLESLAQRGQISREDFGWMEQIADCN
ncbi:uncharacterized protein F4812DRAFT_277731 [Daldinia caldariorum]|uniref:uncharacterized protein n=1 Tax=Daldinia caldariorum TaxID=326644 RepID=UPI002007BD84|nr:uncharacterized protein F4812DRAFT_277731 [Daldinia caldariorum]KAI1470764.1 hypothetical protein F4812DRAFT_277731 [Daldinia caldariorum]